jgi:hypothetical protein
MRYIDSGRRDPDEALGSWLEENALGDPSVVALRWQTGFFGVDSLGYFAHLMARLGNQNGVLRVLVGSNDGITLRSDLEVLLDVAGPPRDNQRIGIVSFDNGYFHPKTIHLARADGSAAAYVGSANLTQSGVTSLHVEVGILLDSNQGDDPSVLTEIADAVDWWFAEPRSGLHVIFGSDDLDRLVNAGTLNVPRPPLVRQQRARGGEATNPSARLTPLVRVPPLPSGLRPETTPSTGATPPPPESVEPSASAAASAPRGSLPTADWRKRLTRSDAQRKAAGNQRGSITLVQAGYPINAQTYFRHDLFANASWEMESTRTGEVRETATIPFAINILGHDLGTRGVTVTYASNREASQANYTSLLHLGPLAPYFVSQDLTGRWLRLERRTDGTYSLSVS